MEALDCLRLEKGYRAWKGDLSTDYTILQGGMDRFVDWSKPDFKGKAAMEREKQQGVTKRFVTLIVDAGECDAPYMSTLWHGGKVVGETTSGGFGHRIGKSIALGMLRADLNVPGTEIEVEIYRRTAARRLFRKTSPCGIPPMKGCGHEQDPPNQGPGRHYRRRRFRLIGRLSSRQARLDGYRAA